MFRKKKSMEEAVVTLVRAELAGIAAELERDRLDHRRRSEARERAWAALEGAETKARRVHLERVALKERFWEAYYQDDRAALSEVERELDLSERAVRKADEALKKANAGFEKVDFDEAAECSALRAKADAVEDAAERRIGALVETLEELLGGIGRDIEEACRALRDECKGPAVAVTQDDPSQSTAELRQGQNVSPKAPRWAWRAARRRPWRRVSGG